jgi:hypothetical protein
MSSGYDDRISSGLDKNEPAHGLREITNSALKQGVAKPQTQPVISINVNMVGTPA